MCSIPTILWEGLLKQETACEQSIKCITCHNLMQLFCACWSGTNLKMKLETVDRILMSRETTVRTPPLSDLTLVQKFLLFFGALLWSVHLCSQKSISHANGDRCSQTVLSEPRPTNQKFLDLPLDFDAASCLTQTCDKLNESF